MGDTLTLLSVHTDLEHAVTLASQAKVKEALDLCSSVMEVVCTHIEILGLVDPDEPGSPHSPTTEKAAALLLGGFDRLGSETTSKPSTTAHPKTAAVNHSQHNNKVLDSESTAKSNSHVKGDLANTNTGTHSFSWATQGSDLMPLTVAHRIEFWQQVNSTWLLAIRCAGTSTEMDLLRQDTTVFTGSRRGSRSRSIRGSKASATAAAADAASTAHALNLSTATANGNAKTDSSQADTEGDLSSAMLIKDWIMLRDNIISCGDVLELYGLVDYTMGFAELEIVEAIHAQISRM